MHAHFASRCIGMKFRYIALLLAMTLANQLVQAAEADPYDALYQDARKCLLDTDGDCDSAFAKCTAYLDSLESDTLAASRFLELGTLRMQTNRWDDLAKHMFDKAHMLNKRSGIPCAIMESQFALAQYARFMNVVDSLQIQSERALQSAVACGDSTRQARAEVYVGSAFLYQSDYAQALEHFQQAEMLYMELNDISGLGGLYLDMALLYAEMHQKEKARRYNRKAAGIFQKTGEDMKYGVSMVDLGSSYLDVKMVDSALYCLSRAEPFVTGKNTRAQGYMEQNFGSAYFLLGRYEEAIEHYEKGIVLSARVGDNNLIVLLNNFISEAYLALGNYKEAHRHALISDTISQRFPRNFLRTRALMALAESAYKVEDYDMSYAAFKRYIVLTDSLFGDEKQKEIAALEQEYEAEKRRKEIEFRKQENELLAKEHAASTNRNYALAACLILLIMVGYALISKQRHKIRGQDAAMRIAQLENEKLNQEVAHKARELTSKALNIAQKNEMIQTLHEQLKSMSKEKGKVDLKGLINKLRVVEQQEGNWAAFTEQFSALNPNFHKRLTSTYPDLSKGELRLAALIRMGLSSKDIANILNISEPGMKKARYRLRKKMSLETEESLETKIMGY